MDKREKVIANVTAIVSDMQEEVDEWKDYSDSELSHGLTCDCDWWYKTLQTLKDALELLKAHEPRVMSLDELSEKEDVYFESLVYDTICPALSSGSYDDGTVGLMTLEDELFYMDEEDYGVKWRCWTYRPTDEQRAATPWKAVTS